MPLPGLDLSSRPRRRRRPHPPVPAAERADIEVWARRSSVDEKMIIAIAC
ncbi:hypothetical protein [Frankia casuarinae]|nr:hypothetical protein [Frankia casuarinae]